MTSTVKNLAETVVQLPVKDRTYLTERLLASLDQADIEQEWITEAKRRRDEVRSGKVKPLTAERVYRQIERLLKSETRVSSGRGSRVRIGDLFLQRTRQEPRQALCHRGAVLHTEDPAMARGMGHS